jgi:hypothetical protein
MGLRADQSSKAQPIYREGKLACHKSALFVEEKPHILNQTGKTGHTFGKFNKLLKFCKTKHKIIFKFWIITIGNTGVITTTKIVFLQLNTKKQKMLRKPIDKLPMNIKKQLRGENINSH